MLGITNRLASSRARIEGDEIAIDVRMDANGSRIGYRISGKTSGLDNSSDFGPFRELIMQGAVVKCAPASIFSQALSFRMDETTMEVINRAVITEEYVVAYDMLLTFIESRISNELALAQRLNKKYALEANLSTLGEIRGGLKNSIVTKDPSVTVRNWAEMLSAEG